MKTVVINAGPKRRDVNAELAKTLKRGAESNGEVTYIDLYRIDLSGCRTCLICKQDGKIGRCYWRDELSPVIDEILSCDCLLIAAPIFFSAPTSHYQALMERLIYCIVDYNVGIAFKGRVNVGLFYTVNYPVDYFEDSVRPHLKQSEDLLGMLNGDVEICTVANISRRDYSDKSDEGLEKIDAKEKQFSDDLDLAFDVAVRLSR